MPSKSRRGRGKHSARSKRRHGTLARVAQPQVAAPGYQPMTTAMPKPSPGVPTPIAAPGVARYPYIASELRRIGILSGIALAILVVLALVWH